MKLEDNQATRAIRTSSPTSQGHTAIDKQIREENIGTTRSGRVVKIPVDLDK
jgi:hypothetical protein